jgi:hypothetical protein
MYMYILYANAHRLGLAFSLTATSSGNLKVWDPLLDRIAGIWNETTKPLFSRTLYCHRI